MDWEMQKGHVAEWGENALAQKGGVLDFSSDLGPY